LTFGQSAPYESCGKYQIYLHAKFHIFLSPLSISTNVILTCLKDQNNKRKLNWKKSLESFSPRRPSAAVPPGPISCASGPLPFLTPRSLPLGAHLSKPSIPPNSPAQRPRVTDGTISGRCRAPSHHLEHAVAVGQLLPCLFASLGHHVPSLTKASRRPAASVDHCQGRCAATMPATRPRAASLLPPPLLTPWAGVV
jgi:hypothetical protein